MSWIAVKETMERQAVGNTRQDLSRAVLEALLAKGYDTVEWDSGSSVCPNCMPLHGQRWDLSQFLTGLIHDAPIFERSHPGDKSCSVIVYCRDSAELGPVRVDSWGLKGGA